MLILIIALAATVFAAQARELFVDWRAVDDAGPGTTKGTAFKTIQAAVDAAEKHDVVTVLPGTYDAGGEFVDGIGYARVNITKPLTLRAQAENPAETCIVGAPDPHTGGYGEKAYRCVQVTAAIANNEAVVISGFTISNGWAATQGTTQESAGNPAGVCGSLVTRLYNCRVWLTDSIVADCHGVRGGGVRFVNAVRCVFTGCEGRAGNAAGRMCNYFHCHFRDNRGAGWNAETLEVNCTYTDPVNSVAEFGYQLPHSSLSSVYYNTLATLVCPRDHSVYSHCLLPVSPIPDGAAKGSVANCVIDGNARPYVSLPLHDWRVRIRPGHGYFCGSKALIAEAAATLPIPEGINVYQSLDGVDLSQQTGDRIQPGAYQLEEDRLCAQTRLLLFGSDDTSGAYTVHMRLKDGESGIKDMTENIQAYLDNPANREISLCRGDWVTRPLFIRRGDFKLRLLDGARLVAKRGEYHGKNDELLSIAAGVKNLVIEGEGSAEIAMHLKDYQDETQYAASEWRHGIRVWGADGVTIRGLTFRGTGGDGIAVNGARHVLIENCRFYDCNRLGIGVTDVHGFTLRKCWFEGNNGTPPRCGVDFEPNSFGEAFVDVLVEDCDFVNHKYAGGLLFHLSPLNAQSEPVSVVVRNCRSTGNRDFGYRVTAAGSAGGPVKGSFRFENCVSTDNGGFDLVLYGLSDNGIQFEFDGCNFDRILRTTYEEFESALAFDGRAVAPLSTESKTRSSGYMRGTVHFVQCLQRAGKVSVHFDMIRETPSLAASAVVSVSDPFGTPLGDYQLSEGGTDVELESRGGTCYTLLVMMSNALVSMSSDEPGAGLRLDKTVHLYRGLPHRYCFKVPADQESVSVVIVAEEPCAARLLNAEGEEVVAGESTQGAKVLRVDRSPTAADEVWTLEFTKVVEDAYFQLPAPLFPYAEFK